MRNLYRYMWVEDSVSGVGSAANAEIALIVGYVGASHISLDAQDAHADSLLEGAKSNNGGGLYKLRIQL
jgi:beta-phosphoglucomutase-like phosphatase (HAD superfamily)